MSTMDERRGASENKFMLNAEQEFKAEARRNKLLAQWAAPLVGKSDVDAYVLEVIKSDFEEAGDEDVFRKVSADLSAGGAGVTDTELRAKIDEFMDLAREQIRTGQ